jgi:NAD(P)-dependent dehydrogenase (short-subunit alcohol dehydrogenase family)
MTDLALEVVDKEDFEALGATTPMGRLGDLFEIAAAAAFLASSDSSFMTGGEVFVDGGFAQV